MAERVLNNIRETAIFLNNDISASPEVKCLYLSLALTNHSCCPNCAWTCSLQPGREHNMELRAIREVAEGEEVTVSYIMVDGRFWHTAARRARLQEGWGFFCSCDLCSWGGEEEVKAGLRALQEEMVARCGEEPGSLDWGELARLQGEVVAAVRGLHSAPILLLRELRSLVHLAQLAREEDRLKGALYEWRERVGEVGVARAGRDLEEEEESLEEWRHVREEGGRPDIREGWVLLLPWGSPITPRIRGQE